METPGVPAPAVPEAPERNFEPQWGFHGDVGKCFRLRGVGALVTLIRSQLSPVVADGAEAVSILPRVKA